MITLPLRGIIGVEVAQSAAARQIQDLETCLTKAAGAVGGKSGPTGAAGLKGLNGKDWCVLTSWKTVQEATGGPYPLSPSDIYEVQTVDRLDDHNYSALSLGMRAFPFVNVFNVAPGKRHQMIDYFNKTILSVRKQPGYIATNFMMSVDSTHAVNVGLYETREEFLAIFRQFEVLRDFAGGAVSGILPTRFGFLPQLPRLRLYELFSTGKPGASPMRGKKSKA